MPVVVIGDTPFTCASHLELATAVLPVWPLALESKVELEMLLPLPPRVWVGRPIRLLLTRAGASCCACSSTRDLTGGGTFGCITPLACASRPNATPICCSRPPYTPSHGDAPSPPMPCPPRPSAARV